MPQPKRVQPSIIAALVVFILSRFGYIFATDSSTILKIGVLLLPFIYTGLAIYGLRKNKETGNIGTGASISRILGIFLILFGAITILIELAGVVLGGKIA